MKGALRAAKVLDTSPKLRSLLPVLRDACALSHDPAASAVRDAISLYLGGSAYDPDVVATPSVVEFVRWLERESEASLAPTLARGAVLVTNAVTAMSTVVQEHALHPQLQLPHVAEVEGTLERTHALEPGSLLIGSATSNETPRLPGRDVLLVLDVVPRGARERALGLDGRIEGEGRGGLDCWGVAVHRPFPGQLSEITGHSLGGPMDKFVPFFGGVDDPTRSMLILHPFAGLTNGQQLTGSIEEANKYEPGERTPFLFAGAQRDEVHTMLQEGVALEDDFKVILGATKFHVSNPNSSTTSATTDTTTTTTNSNGEVDDVRDSEDGEEEWGLEEFCLFRGSAVAPLVLLPPQFEAPAGGDPDLAESRLSPATEAAAAHYDHNRFFHQDLVWCEAMRRCDVPELQDIANLHPATVITIREMLGGELLPDEMSNFQ